MHLWLSFWIFVLRKSVSIIGSSSVPLGSPRFFLGFFGSNGAFLFKKRFGRYLWTVGCLELGPSGFLLRWNLNFYISRINAASQQFGLCKHPVQRHTIHVETAFLMIMRFVRLPNLRVSAAFASVAFRASVCVSVSV